MIQTTEQITAAIKSGAVEVVSHMLRDLIKDHRGGDGKRRFKLWERYRLADVPIYHRKPSNYERVDRKTACDFYADIVDTKTGYMGNEVTVSLDREAYKTEDVLNETRFESDRQHLRFFMMQTASEDVNSEMVRAASATGIGYRLLYVPEGRNEIRLKNLQPWEVIYIYDQSIDEPQVAIRYYTIVDNSYGHNAKYRELTVVEWYDAENITYYIDDGNLEFTIDTTRGFDGVQPHMFSGIPIIPFPNNELLTAEPEKVTDLIDAYDAIISSTTSEIEQLRLAYMFAKSAGLQIDDEFIHQLEQTGIFPLDSDGEVGFINKQISDAPVHNLLAEIRRNIYQFAKSIDMSKDFGGDMRVIGWQVALLNLENSCKITERKFVRALRKQYELVTEYWKKFQGVDIDPFNLEFTFTRNFPRDIQAEAETLQLLLNSVSTETALSQMSFIDDPEAEIAKMEAEGSPYRGINEPGFTDERQDSREDSGQGN